MGGSDECFCAARIRKSKSQHEEYEDTQNVFLNEHLHLVDAGVRRPSLKKKNGFIMMENWRLGWSAWLSNSIMV